VRQITQRLRDGRISVIDVPAPVAITGEQVTVAAANDAITVNVASPYLAEASSVVFPGVTGVITDASGNALAFHRTY